MLLRSRSKPILLAALFADSRLMPARSVVYKSSVNAAEWWPRRSWTTLGFAPDISRFEPCVLRKSWKRARVPVRFLKSCQTDEKASGPEGFER